MLKTLYLPATIAMLMACFSATALRAASIPLDTVYVADDQNTVALVNSRTQETFASLSLLLLNSSTPVGAPILIAGSNGYIYASATEDQHNVSEPDKSVVSHIFRISSDGTGMPHSGDIFGTIKSLALSPDGNTLFFGFDNGIATCDTSTLVVNPTLIAPVPKSTILGLASDGTELFFAKIAGSPVSLMDTVQVLPLTGGASFSIVYNKNVPPISSTPVIPSSVVENPKTQTVYAVFTQLLTPPSAISNAGIVAVFPQQTNSVASILGVGLNPIKSLINVSTGFIYVLNKDSMNVSVIDTSKNAVIATVALPDTPVDMALDSGAATLFVVLATKKIQVIDTVSNAIIDDEPPPAPPVRSGFGTIAGTTASVAPATTGLVTGAETKFTLQVQSGDSIVASGQTQLVVSVDSDTTLTVKSPFNPSLEYGTPYMVLKARAPMPISTPTSIAAIDAVTDSLSIGSFRIALFSKKIGYDQVGLVGSVIAKSNGTRAISVSVNIGGVIKTFPLLSNGVNGPIGFKGHTRFAVQETARGLTGIPRRVQFSMTIQDTFLKKFKSNVPVDSNGLPTKIPITVFFAGTNYTTSINVAFTKNGNAFTASSESTPPVK